MPTAPLALDRDDLAALTRFERTSLGLGSFINSSPRLKRATRLFNEQVTGRWMRLVSEARIELVGLEHATGLTADRGVLLAANHRSFFDMFMVLTHLHRHVSWWERAYFPVRSAFWYDHPLGVVVNAVASAMSMYPPIYRESEKRGATRAGLDFLAKELERPGTVVGIHPEGTRNKGSDPYELLPGEPGFGRVVLQGRPIVLPIFINGMSNDFIKECRSTFDRTGPPIFIVIGKPVEFGELLDADPQRLRSQIAVTRRVLEAIAELMPIEKRRRELCR